VSAKTLSDSYGAQNGGFSNLFTPAGLIWSVMVSVDQVLIKLARYDAR
jgi:hypothetical protein